MSKPSNMFGQLERTTVKSQHRLFTDSVAAGREQMALTQAALLNDSASSANRKAAAARAQAVNKPIIDAMKRKHAETGKL
jgi:hypothetical protein